MSGSIIYYHQLLFAGQSTVSAVDDSVRELLPGRPDGGSGSILLDAILCRRAVHQDHDGLWGVVVGRGVRVPELSFKKLVLSYIDMDRVLLDGDEEEG